MRFLEQKNPLKEIRTPIKCWKFFFTLEIKKIIKITFLPCFYPKYTIHINTQIQPIQYQFGRNLHKTHKLAKK